MDDYDVFLNHRGPDVKGGFIAHLHDALQTAGLNPFLDKNSLTKGSPAFTSIDAALEGARVHVAVVSRGYAESKHCLSELASMMRSNKPVIPVFYDVEPSELRRVEKGRFAAAFRKHRRRESAEQVQEWVEALRKLADITGFCFRLSDYEGNEAKLKHEVVNALQGLLPSQDALQVESHLVGLEEHVKTCVNRLLKTSGATSILGLVGMGGIGKTSLAKVIYNHLIGCGKFQAMSFLEVGSPSSMEVGSNLLKRLQKQLLWDLLRIPESNQARSYEYWVSKLSSKGPVLIILDDIQDKGQFDQLIDNTSLLASGSCIIVTSRDQQLLKLIGGSSNIYLYEVTPLGCEDSQKLFNWHAFASEEAPKNFTAIARDVSEACGGLPLALKVVGSSLFGKTSNEDRNHIWLEAIDALKGNRDVLSALRWSYNCLTEPEKLMFVDIACVFCGWKKDEVLEIWKSCKNCSSCCGNGAPHTSLRQLIDKSLVILDNSGAEDVLIIHGLLRDMGQGIGEVEGSHLRNGKAIKALLDKHQNSNRVRAINLANNGKNCFEVRNFAKMPNLHFLILDGCDVCGNLESISDELRYLQWRHMPLTQIPPILKLSNLIALDFSRSTKLADTWIESEPALEGCPNLLRLDFTECTSITTLPNSIGRLSSLQVLTLNWCKNLQKLPNSIGQLASLEELRLKYCERLEALPDSITALSGLQRLYMQKCSSISELPATIGLITALTDLHIDLATENQGLGVGQLNALQRVMLSACTDKVISVLDTSGTLRNLHQLSILGITESPAMTKLPDTINLLMNLEQLLLWNCAELRELPNSIGQLKVLRRLYLRYCSSLETLPDSLGALTSLQELWIVECTSITNLPTCVGRLSGLRELVIQGCGALQPLPDSLKQLNALVRFQIMDCGSSLEGLGLLRVLQGLRIWGCTSVRELVGSCLVVVDCNVSNAAWIWDGGEFVWVRRNVKEMRVVEADDCGFLRHVREDTESGRVILQRVHNLPCCKLAGVQTFSPSPGGAISSDDQIRSDATSSESWRSHEKKLDQEGEMTGRPRRSSFRSFLAAEDLHDTPIPSQQPPKRGNFLRQILSRIKGRSCSSGSSPHE